MEPVSAARPSFEGKQPVTEVIIRTRNEDIDVNSHVNNIHFTAWALEGVPENISGVMTLKEAAVIFRNEARKGEEITVKTFDNGNNTFWHILTRNSDGKEISSAYTAWQ
jgi:acyl-ACP thioesterase